MVPNSQQHCNHRLRQAIIKEVSNNSNSLITVQSMEVKDKEVLVEMDQIGAATLVSKDNFSIILLDMNLVRFRQMHLVHKIIKDSSKTIETFIVLHILRANRTMLQGVNRIMATKIPPKICLRIKCKLQINNQPWHKITIQLTTKVCSNIFRTIINRRLCKLAVICNLKMLDCQYQILICHYAFQILTDPHSLHLALLIRSMYLTPPTIAAR